MKKMLFSLFAFIALTSSVFAENAEKENVNKEIEFPCRYSITVLDENGKYLDSAIFSVNTDAKGCLESALADVSDFQRIYGPTAQVSYNLTYNG